MSDDVHHHLVEEGGQRLDRWLADRLPISRSAIQRMIQSSSILVDGKYGSPSLKLKGGEQIWVDNFKAPPTHIEPQNIPLDIQHMDDDLLVVNKPSGMVVHPGKGNHDGTLVNGIVKLIQDDVGDPLRPGLVHRIDKGTSGLLVVARTPQALLVLQAQFAAHTTHRLYLALGWGRPKSNYGKIDEPLGRHPVDRIRFACVPSGKSALTHWWHVGTGVHPQSGRGGEISLFLCRLETGRTHQIRVHMASIGHPLLGDPLYGKKRGVQAAWQRDLKLLDHQLLHAWQLGFTHPNQSVMHFEIPPPEDFIVICEKAGIQWADARKRYSEMK